MVIKGLRALSKRLLKLILEMFLGCNTQCCIQCSLDATQLSKLFDNTFFKIWYLGLSFTHCCFRKKSFMSLSHKYRTGFTYTSKFPCLSKKAFHCWLQKERPTKGVSLAVPHRAIIYADASFSMGCAHWGSFCLEQVDIHGGSTEYNIPQIVPSSQAFHTSTRAQYTCQNRRCITQNLFKSLRWHQG